MVMKPFTWFLSWHPSLSLLTPNLVIGIISYWVYILDISGISLHPVLNHHHLFPEQLLKPSVWSPKKSLYILVLRIPESIFSRSYREWAQGRKAIGAVQWPVANGVASRHTPQVPYLTCALSMQVQLQKCFYTSLTYARSLYAGSQSVVDRVFPSFLRTPRGILMGTHVNASASSVLDCISVWFPRSPLREELVWLQLPVPLSKY